MSFPVSANKGTATEGRERSPVEEAILEDLEAWPLLNFSSLSSSCFTPAGAQVPAAGGGPKCPRSEMSCRGPCARPCVCRGGREQAQRGLRSVGVPSGLGSGLLSARLLFQTSVRGQAPVSPRSLPSAQTLTFGEAPFQGAIAGKIKKDKELFANTPIPSKLHGKTRPVFQDL